MVPSVQRAVVVVPAHNEVARLPACLRALATASLCLPVPVTTVVVLDSCDDGTDALAGQFGTDVHFLEVDAGNVGAARAAGFEYARTLYGDDEEERVFFATTDADSVVDADWLVRMVAADADMVLGVVRVRRWRHVSPEVARRYVRGYRSRGPGHRHVHGANMGFRASAYWRVGGFRALRTGEDVELVERFAAAGLPICRDCNLSVTTSDRKHGRAPGGFAQHLRNLTRTGRKSDADAS
jgi:glycosyltransferase involved in cell wall biosynthesis